MSDALAALEKAADDCADGGWDARERRLVTLADAKKIVSSIESRLHQLSEDHSHCEDLLHELGERVYRAESRLSSILTRCGQIASVTDNFSSDFQKGRDDFAAEVAAMIRLNVVEPEKHPLQPKGAATDLNAAAVENQMPFITREDIEKAALEPLPYDGRGMVVVEKQVFSCRVCDSNPCTCGAD